MYVKRRLYQVYAQIHRNSSQYLAMVYALAPNKPAAEQYMRSLFGWNDPHPFHVKAWRDSEITPQKLVDFYGRSIVQKAADWDVQTMTPDYHRINGGI